MAPVVRLEDQLADLLVAQQGLEIQRRLGMPHPRMAPQAVGFTPQQGVDAVIERIEAAGQGEVHRAPPRARARAGAGGPSSWGACCVPLAPCA